MVVVAAGLLGEAEGVEDAFVAEEVTWKRERDELVDGGFDLGAGSSWGVTDRILCWWRLRGCPCR